MIHRDDLEIGKIYYCGRLGTPRDYDRITWLIEITALCDGCIDEHYIYLHESCCKIRTGTTGYDQVIREATAEEKKLFLLKKIC